MALDKVLPLRASPLLPPTLVSPRLCLRPLTAADAPAIFEYAADEEVARHMLWDAHQSIADTTRFLGLVAERYACAEPFDWGLEFRGRIVGTIGLFDHRGALERAEVGYCLGRAYWGQGLMREALDSLLEHAFCGLALRRVVARAHIENIASHRLLHAAGFAREGTLREDVYAKGSWWTVAYFGLLAGEFRPLQSAGQPPHGEHVPERRRRSPPTR